MVLSGIWRKQEGPRENIATSLVVRREKDVCPQDLQDLCASVGWSRRDPLLITRALNKSLAVISVWDGPVLVGFARATGDEVFNATIWDVAVRPAYQRKGVGRLVMQELLAELDTFSIPLVTLYADPGRDGFYKKFGFATDPSGVRGMFRERF
jgi:GNAT superfamily N-acetyltransferase